MKIKVCGIANNEFIESAENIDIDYIGFIFYTQSKRYLMQGMFLREILSLPQRIKKVGVFVNEAEEVILKIANQYKLDFIQLHGDEEIEFAYAGAPARGTENSSIPGGLAGSGLTMDRAVRNAVTFLDLDLPLAVRSGSKI